MGWLQAMIAKIQLHLDWLWWGKKQKESRSLSLWESTTLQLSQQVGKIISYCHRWSCSSPLVSLQKCCTLTLSRLWSGNLDPHHILLILLHASCDCPMHRTWTFMLAVQVYMNGQSSNLGKKIEDFEAEISLICVIKASWYVHMRESKVDSIKGEIRQASLFGNQNSWANTSEQNIEEHELKGKITFWGQVPQIGW